MNNKFFGIFCYEIFIENNISFKIRVVFQLRKLMTFLKQKNKNIFSNEL